VIVVDTNVIVRLLTGEVSEEARRAAALLDEHAVVLLRTVVLETEWVLRHTYRFDRMSVNNALREVLAARDVITPDHALIERALGWHARGLDFADALHLAAVPSDATLATFDRRLRQRAGELDGAPPVIAP
jgi:predicted nucleic acid-binding protein